MIIGSGIDIVEIDRMGRAIKQWGDPFLKRIFTKREMDYSQNKRQSSQHYAARFAAKEAVIKAFGKPKTMPMNLTDIEVLNDREGKPVVRLHGKALNAKRHQKVFSVVLSMSHSHEYAVASVILEAKGG